MNCYDKSLPHFNKAGHKFFSLLIFVLFFALLPNLGFAYNETFYVSHGGNGTQPENSTCGANGTCWDENDFNNSANWATVDAADGKIGPNDLVVILRAGGTLSNSTDALGILRPRQSGLSGKPITIQGESGSMPVVNGQTQKACIFISSMTYIIVRNLDCTNGEPFGIQVWESDYITIQDCHVHHARRANIVWTGSEGLVDGCDLHSSIEEHGVYLCDSGSGSVVQNTYIHDNPKAGIQINTDSDRIYGTHIRYNWIENNLETGINEVGGDGTEIYGNVIVNTVGDSYHAIFLGDTDSGPPPINTKIFNNTIYGNWGWIIAIENSSTGNAFKNNIVYQVKDSTLVTVDSGSTCEFDNNVWYQNPFGWYFNYHGNWVSSLGEWQNALGGCPGTGNGCNDQFVNPFFVDAANGNFSLQKDSPCIDAGEGGADSPYSMMLDPGASRETFGVGSSNSLVNQANYGTAFEVGAYVHKAAAESPTPAKPKNLRVLQ